MRLPHVSYRPKRYMSDAIERVASSAVHKHSSSPTEKSVDVYKKTQKKLYKKAHDRILLGKRLNAADNTEDTRANYNGSFIDYITQNWHFL